jgi:hypothetical protein
MKNLFYMGGPLFMGILTALLIVLVAWTVYHFLPVFFKKEKNFAKTRSQLKQIKTIGTFALITSVAPALLMGGLKVSMITTIYGILIFLFSLLIWFIADLIVSKKSE